jgi:hypothetical protein
MAAPIRILQSQANDLAVACKVGAVKLRAVAAAIEAADLTIKREKLRRIVSTIVDGEDTAALCRIIFGLSGIDSRNDFATSDTIEGVSETLKSFGEDDRFSDWPAVGPALGAILSCRSVHFTAKAVDVSYDFERILSDSRILTSIRPIYTAKRDEIVSGTLVQTLRLDYVNSAGRSDSISIAVDLSDIIQLKEICGQAEEKARVARQRLEKDWGIEVLMAGEDAQ